MKSDIFINSIPLDEALDRWFPYLKEKRALLKTKSEIVKVEAAIQRVTARAIFAINSSPSFHSSAMDGYALRFTDTIGASETSPKKLRIGLEAIYVDTGGPLPDGFDSVVMVEDVNVDGDFIEIIAPLSPYKNVRTVGEDIVATQLILPENHIIRPVDVAALLASGYIEVEVRKKPIVSVIPTGNEIVEPGAPLSKGKIIESNSYMIKHMVEECGGEVQKEKIVPDDLEMLKSNLLARAEEADIVLVLAGSSAGRRDFTNMAIKETGEIVFHGVNIKPGRPVICGIVNDTPVLGLPGYPVSTYIAFNIFVKPLIEGMLFVYEKTMEQLECYLSRPLSSTLGVKEYVRMKLGMVSGRFTATPLGRGAGLLMSLTRADGIYEIPEMSEGPGAGAKINVSLLKPKREIEDTIVCIGSHDNALDALYNFIKMSNPNLSLSSANVGSMGGIVAIKKDEAHVAGTHLLDENTGTYNISFVQQILKDTKVLLINLVYRLQGLMVQKGNPKGIKNFHDLLRDDVVFINRQSGSGTRLLTDKTLKDEKISANEITGYDQLEFTHMGVAQAVVSHVADAGVGILSAANALGLDFIPLAKERYDLLVRASHYDLHMIQAFFDVIRNNDGFRHFIYNMGGYDIEDMGKVVYES